MVLHSDIPMTALNILNIYRNVPGLINHGRTFDWFPIIYLNDPRVNAAIISPVIEFMDLMQDQWQSYSHIFLEVFSKKILFERWSLQHFYPVYLYQG